jgi:hypothetical protein
MESIINMENIVYVGLESKNPHTTCFLHIKYRGDFPQNLETLLNSVGWKRDEFAPASPLDGVAELDFGKDGTGILFNEWTDEEYKKNMREIKKTLKSVGLVPTRYKLTLADLL